MGMLLAGLAVDAVEADGKDGWNAASAAAASQRVDLRMSVFWILVSPPWK
jgi:hypothetical protein